MKKNAWKALVAAFALVLGVSVALPARAVADEPIVLDGPSVGDDDIELHVFKVDADTKDNLKGAHLQIIDKETNKVVVDWESDGQGPFKVNKSIDGVGLNDNKTYILHEVTAPDGYEKASDTEFRLESGSDGSVGFMTELTLLSSNDEATLLAPNGSAAQLQLTNAKRVQEVEVEQLIERNNEQGPTSESKGDSRSGKGKLSQTGDNAPTIYISVLGIAGLFAVAVALRCKRKQS